ncbi:MAG TPA: tRNA pseudouridine(55) synthase TruB [Nitrosomonas sp.]|nr:tRNA pseudouridine(55) synthase TruB [Nitrosomonas sp.]
MDNLLVNPHSSPKSWVKRKINGVLLLNKPKHISSNRALQVVKRFYRASKAGHTGTLDPMATGLLTICFGEATKFSSMLLNADKTYLATLRLGYISTTGDAEGEIRSVNDLYKSKVELIPFQVQEILNNFLGKTNQTAPLFSALKLNGKPLYHYARANIVVERKVREVNIYDINLLKCENDVLTVRVRCSSGTYIRTLAEDIGKAMGWGGAYLTDLCRSQVGLFCLDQAYGLDQFQDDVNARHDSLLYPVDSLLQGYHSVVLSEEQVSLLFNGQVVSKENEQELPMGNKVKLYDLRGNFLGIGETIQANQIRPKRLVSH